MTRLILTDQDLSKQTIEGRPFSYIGRCTGTDVKFVGDWTHVSYFKNNFLRPDWSKAKTRGSYSRFNTFTDARTSQDVELLDHDMMVAALEEGFGPTTGNVRWGLAQVIVGLRGKYMMSWSNLSPPFLEAMGGDMTKALSAVQVFMGGRDQLIKQYAKMSTTNPDRATWRESIEPHIDVEGVDANSWGVSVKSKGRTYHKHWMELPIPKNPHDRCELAEIIEAEAIAATGVDITLYIQSILPWRVYGTWGKKRRDWLLC